MESIGGQLVAFWQRIWWQSRIPSESKYVHDGNLLSRIDLSKWEYDAITAYLQPLMKGGIPAKGLQETLFGVPIYITGC